ncbi:MAG: hypothetical protein AABZ53_06370 [Planctomycetota bacterium]
MSSESNDNPQAKGKKDGGPSTFLSELRGTSTQSDTPAPSKSSRIVSTHILTLALLAFGGASLYGMRVYSQRTGMAGERVDVSLTPLGVDSVTEAQTRRVLADLECQGIPEQVPLEGSRRNPFALVSVGNVAVVDDSDHRLSEEQRRLAEEKARLDAVREQEIASTLESLEITSVMLGPRPIARISGKIYRVGDKVAKVFSVLEIGERGVKLGCDGREYERLMKSELNSGSHPDDNDIAPGAPTPRGSKK